MPKRRRKKKATPSVHAVRQQIQRLKKQVPRVPQLSRMLHLPHLPHSSVFAVGIGIGLAVGLVGGLSLAWLERPHHAATKPTQVAAAVPPKIVIVPAPAPAPTPTLAPTLAPPPAPAATVPTYAEQTEPQPDD